MLIIKQIIGGTKIITSDISQKQNLMIVIGRIGNLNQNYYVFQQPQGPYISWKREINLSNFKLITSKSFKNCM